MPNDRILTASEKTIPHAAAKKTSGTRRNTHKNGLIPSDDWGS